MVKRNLTKHDKIVKRVAAGYKGKGWKVKADVSGYPKPKTIYGKRVDVFAIKGKRERAVEIETPKTYKKDSSQRKAFKRWASGNKKRKFRTKIAR